MYQLASSLDPGSAPIDPNSGVLEASEGKAFFQYLVPQIVLLWQDVEWLLLLRGDPCEYRPSP